MTRQLSKFMTAVPRIGECVIYLLIFTIGAQMNAVLCLIITFPTVSTIFKSSPHEDLCLVGGFFSRLSRLCRCLGVSRIFSRSFLSRRFSKKAFQEAIATELAAPK